MLQLEVADFTGTVWMTMFDELATSLLETSADELAQLQRDDHYRFDAIFNKIRFHDFVFRIRAKYEIYNDQENLKLSVFDVKPVQYEKLKTIYSNALKNLPIEEEMSHVVDDDF